MNDEDYLTLREAAQQLSITHQAIRSRARHRGIQLTQTPGIHGLRYMLHKQDLERLRDGLAEPSRKAVQQDGTVLRNRSARPSHETVLLAHEAVPLPAHLETLRILKETQQSLQQAQSQTQRLERQATFLQVELASYQRALSEHAESLAENTTIARQTEIRASLAENERAILQEENRQLREQFEQEREALTIELLSAKIRVNWIEKKVPNWLRRMLGAS